MDVLRTLLALALTTSGILLSGLGLYEMFWLNRPVQALVVIIGSGPLFWMADVLIYGEPGFFKRNRWSLAATLFCVVVLGMNLSR